MQNQGILSFQGMSRICFSCTSHCVICCKSCCRMRAMHISSLSKIKVQGINFAVIINDLLERTNSFLIFQIPNRRNMLGNAQFVIIILHISFFENLMWKKSFMSCKQFADKSIQWVVICQLFFFVCVSCAWREKSLQKLIFCINQNALSLAFLFHFTFTAHSHCFQPQILYF